MTVTKNDLRKKLMAYVDDKTTLDEFKEWFIPLAWRDETERNPGLDEIVAEVELRLAEFSEEAWTEADLKRLLRQIAAVHSRVS